jgi:hypothetical protein
MAKGSMLSKAHSRIGKFASWDEPETAQHSNTGQRNWENRFGGPLARSVRPSSHVRSQYRERAEAVLRLLVNKRANRHAGTQSPRSWRATPAPKIAVRSDGPAPYCI